MTDVASTPSEPVAKPRWWDRPKLLRGLLIASLALNLLIASAVATRLVRGDRIERMPGASQVQLVPRKFLRELPAEKRKAARQIFRQLAEKQRGDRQWVREVSLKLADALTAAPYDAEKVKAVLAEYANRSEESASRSGAAALELMALLTPEERVSLATAIRERATPRR